METSLYNHTAVSDVINLTTESYVFNTTNTNGSRLNGESTERTIWTWILSISLFIVAVVTFLGNGLVLVTFFLDKRLLKSNFNMFLINLTLTDITISLTAIPFFGVNYFFGYWPFGKHLCTFWIFCDWGMTFASVYTLLAISLDRYWAVCRSHHYRAHNTRRRTIGVIAAVWTLVLIVWLPPYINDRVRIETLPDPECMWSVTNRHNHSFAIFMAVAGYHLPSVIIVYCYIRVFLKMKRSQKGFSTQHRRHVQSPRDRPNTTTQSTLTINSYRSTDSDIGTDFKETPKQPSNKPRVLSAMPTNVDDLPDEDCSVRIIVTDRFSQHSDTAGEDHLDVLPTQESRQADNDETSFNHRDRSSSFTAGMQANNNLLRVPLTAQREEMESSNLSLDLPTPVLRVLHRERRRPCSFTEGTKPGGVFVKRSLDGATQRRKRTSSDLRTSRAKHISTVSQVTCASRVTVQSSWQSKEYKLFVRVSYILITYLVCWTPFHIVFDCQLAGIEVDQNWYTFAVLMCYLNSTINPLLYALGNPKLKAAFVSTLECGGICKR